MIKVSDFIANFLVKKKINDIFLVSGGGAMHLVDSVGKHKKLNYISNHHEQASAIAGEAWARVKGRVSACLVTTGPGGTNAITGVADAWTDSIPMIIISGQVRSDIMADPKKLRQFGPQEINIVDIVKPITKYAKVLLNLKQIEFELEKAYHLATTERPGPVWIDVPLDIQGMKMDEKKQISFVAPQKKSLNQRQLSKLVDETIKMINFSQRPVLIAGGGIRLSGGVSEFGKLKTKLQIPVLLPYNGIDLVEENDPLCAGKFGPLGQRRGNFTLQNSDLILSLGSSLSLVAIGFDHKGFAPKAKKIMVNIDEEEIRKKILKIDLKVASDVNEFMRVLNNRLSKKNVPNFKRWQVATNQWKNKYPTIIPEFFKDKRFVNSYVFYDILSNVLNNKDVILSGNSLDSVGLYQAFKVKKGQRVFTNTNFGNMGWGLPASIGACVANKQKQTILVVGDGSIQFNSQELETIKCYKLPIKIFVFNNDGYQSIRFMQDGKFNSRYVGADEKSGVTNPDFKLLAKAHSIKYEKISHNDNLERIIKRVINSNSAVICEVMINPKQERQPRVSSAMTKDGKLESRPLHDMYPFLSRKEVKENMKISKI